MPLPVPGGTPGLGSYKKVQDRYLKKLGIDAEDEKQDIVGSSGGKYDIYQGPDGDLFVGPKNLTDVNQLTPLNIRIVGGQVYFGLQPGQSLPGANGGDNQPPDPLCEASFDSASECGDPFGDLFGGDDGDFFGDFFAAFYGDNACTDQFNLSWMTEIRVSFSVQSDSCTPDEISSLLGLQPDRAWRIGETLHSERPGVPRLGTFHYWRLDGRPRQENPSVEDVLVDLLARLAPHREALQSLRGRVEMGFRIYVADADLDVETFGLHLEPVWLEQIAALHAALSITVA